MEQEKKSIFKKWWFWALVVVLIAGVGGESEVEETTTIESTQVAEEKPVVEETVKEEPVVEKTEEVQAKPKLDENAIMAVAKAALKDSFDNVDIKKTTNGSTLYNVLLTSKGFTQATLHYNLNDSKTKKAYDKMVKNMQDLCKTYNKLLAENGLEGEFCISIVNDVNTENVLLTTLEDTVIYSAFE